MAAVLTQKAGEQHSSCCIKELKIEDVAELDDVTSLHMQLLDYGPMAGLGPRFVRDICYAAHLEDDLLKIALCTVDGKPAGFAAYTAWSITFHRRALKQHWIRACWVLTISLLEDPRRLTRLFRAVRVVWSRREEQKTGTDPSGEVVAIAVKPEFSSAKFVRRTGRRISQELVTHASKYLQRCSVFNMRMLVDADNKAPLFLYHALGASFEDYEQAGEPMVQVKFELQERPIAEVESVPDRWRLRDERVGRDAATSDWFDYWEKIPEKRKIFRREAQDYVQRLRQRFPLSDKTRVLDFGCGFGFTAELLSPAVNTVSLWDASFNVRRKALLRTAALDNVVYEDFSASLNNSLRRSFDLIVSHSVFQYMKIGEIRGWLVNMREMLAEDGQIVISDLLSPDVNDMVELGQFLRFSLEHGYFLHALWEGAREYRHYRGARAAIPLTRLSYEQFADIARDAELGCKQSPENLSYRKDRYSVVLTHQVTGAAAP